MESDDAGERFWRQSHGREKAAVKLAGAEVDGLGDLVHADGASRAFNESDGARDGGIRETSSRLHFQGDKVAGEFIGREVEKGPGGRRANAHAVGEHGARWLDMKRAGELTGDKTFGLIFGAGRVVHNEFHAAIGENRLDLGGLPFERPQTFDPWGEMGWRRLL